jgi:ankyrin repeat protein
VAALFGHIDAVKCLLKLGAKVSEGSYYGQTPLHLALMKGHFSLARLLVEEGHANPNQPTLTNENAFTLATNRPYY